MPSSKIHDDLNIFASTFSISITIQNMLVNIGVRKGNEKKLSVF